MIKISAIHIKRFRSIMDLVLEVDTSNNFLTICGENNAGKTNVFRAINLFFHPEQYSPNVDVPSHKYYGTRGGAVDSVIALWFETDEKSTYYIRRDFKLDPTKP